MAFVEHHEEKIDEFWDFYDFEDVEIVVLRHEIDNETLRANPQDIIRADWHGGTGQFAQWLVRPDIKNNLARFQNSKTGHYLRIHRIHEDNDPKNNKYILDVSGDDDGKDNIFKLHKQSIGVYHLESNVHENQFISVSKENGIQIGEVTKHSRIHLFNRGEAKSFTFPYLFALKNTVVIEAYQNAFLNVKNEKDNDVRATGHHWDDDTSIWEAESHEKGRFIKIKNLKNGKYLRITKNGDDATCDGDGDAECNLEVHVIDAQNHVKLSSVKWPDSYIAVENSKVKIGKGGGYCKLTFYRE